MSRIRIMHVVRSLETGGTQEGIRKLLSGLDPDRFEQVVCTVIPGGECAGPARTTNLGWSPERSGLLASALARVFRRERPHIVHSRNWATIEAVPAAKLAGVPGVVHSEHGLDVHSMRSEPWRRRAFRRLCFRWADCCIAVSRGLQAHYVNQVGGAAERMHVVANGVDTNRFHADAQARRAIRSHLKVSESALLAGTVSRLDPVKDHRCLFAAADLAIARGADIHLVVVGDGSERAALHQAVENRPRLHGRVFFAGEVKNVADWMNGMDVFVLPSLAEGMSNTLLEAMAVGVAPVASRVGGNPELIESGESGLLFNAGDAEELASCLNMLFREEAWRQKLAAAARRRVEGEFSLQRMLQGYTQLYESVLAGKRVAEPPARRVELSVAQSVDKTY